MYLPWHQGFSVLFPRQTETGFFWDIGNPKLSPPRWSTDKLSSLKNNIYQTKQKIIG